MTKPERALSDDVDLVIVNACKLHPSQKHWEQFFQHFESRFRNWIRNTLRDGNQADREDLYQTFAAALLGNEILKKLETDSDPNPYLHKCLTNLARKHHEQITRHPAEPLDDEGKLLDRLRIVADEAPAMQEDEIFRRLYETILHSDISEKKLQTFFVLLKQETLKHKTLEEIALETGFSTSAVGRYVDEIRALSYAALGVPLTGQKKKLKNPGKF